MRLPRLLSREYCVHFYIVFEISEKLSHIYYNMCIFYLLSTEFLDAMCFMVAKLIKAFFFQVSLNSSVWQWDWSVLEAWTVAFTLE